MNQEHSTTPLWRPFEIQLNSTQDYENPFQAVLLQARFSAPSGETQIVDGFWNGGADWCVRFMPDERGTWEYGTTCTDAGNTGLHGHKGSFVCGDALNETRFDRHGAIRVSADQRYLEHADGTPFFWLADTVWNGPLLSTDEEWETYLRTRAAQDFTAAQWITTQWIASPQGDRNGDVAYRGTDCIAVNPTFFKRLDTKAEGLNRVGMLSAPVLLWAARWMRKFSDNAINPGLSLPEAQAILLARYMVARWGALHGVWILNGDGHYHETAERWHTIGRGVFGGREHAPVTLHPGGWMWDHPDFSEETWLDLWGYQSAHKLDEESLRFLTDGPMAHEWDKPPIHPIINLEPPYEDHNDMSSDGARRIDAHAVRRALYTSLLIAPTAGVSYGGHGVWGWDDGNQLPTAHPLTGVAKPWREALHLPAAEEMPHLYKFFNSFDFWRLRPAPEMVLAQPGTERASQMIAAAKTDAGDIAVIYTPEARSLELRLDALAAPTDARWFNPTTGAYTATSSTGTTAHAIFQTPAEGDWVLWLSSSKQ